MRRRNAIRRTRASQFARARPVYRKKWKTTYRKKKRSKYGRVYKPKTARVSGVHQPLSIAPELKYTEQDSINIAVDTSNTTYALLWDSNGYIMNVLPPAVGSRTCIKAPVNALTEIGYIGTKINAISAEVIITLKIDQTYSTTYYDYLSLVVASPRIDGLRNGRDYPLVPGDPILPFDNKQWNVMYTKKFYWNNGKTTGGTVPPPAVWEKTFRFKIPLKGTLEVQKNGNSVATDLGRFFWRRPVCIMAMSKYTGMIVIDRIWTKFFYKDP